jgi:uncharacterized protein
MKISQDLRLAIDKGRTDQKTSLSGNVRFGELVQKQENKLQIEQLNKLMANIDIAGQRLDRSRTFKDLANYKLLVKQFVEQAVDFGMELKQSHSWNSQGQSRSLKIVEEIDQTLITLTEDILAKEKQSIDILGKIGEVKGLLINLYM